MVAVEQWKAKGCISYHDKLQCYTNKTIITRPDAVFSIASKITRKLRNVSEHRELNKVASVGGCCVQAQAASERGSQADVVQAAEELQVSLLSRFCQTLQHAYFVKHAALASVVVKFTATCGSVNVSSVLCTVGPKLLRQVQCTLRSTRTSLICAIVFAMKATHTRAMSCLRGCLCLCSVQHVYCAKLSNIVF